MKKKKEKRLSYEALLSQNKSLRKSGSELLTLGNSNCFLQGLNASSQNIDLGEEKK
jgi:hypothetical protein